MICMEYCLECNAELVGKFTIKFCGRSCAAKYTNRKRKDNGWTMSKSSRDAISASLAGTVGHPNKTKGTHLIEREIRVCGECKNQFKALVSSKNKYCSKECGNMHRGGYREHSGRSKTGYYKGIYCGSTYELCWVIYRLDHNLPVMRYNGYILYNNGKKYYPDFVDGKHIFEIKGFKSETTDIVVNLKSAAALSAGYTIDILYKEDLATEFKWVKEKYNTENFYTLYDNYKPKFTYICNNCDKEFFKDSKSNTAINYCCRVCAGKGHTGRKINGDIG